MMGILTDLYSLRFDKTRHHPVEALRIRGIWNIQQFFRPHERECNLNYGYVVCQTAGTGCCYYPQHEDVRINGDLVGGDARECESDNIFLRIALLDAVYATLSTTPALTVTLTGSAREKAKARARLIVREALRLVPQRRRPRVALVGVVGTIIDELREAGVMLRATDLSPALVGRRINSTRIADGEETLEIVRGSHVAIVTGMTLATATIDAIVSTARRNSCRLVFFCQTGANLASEYTRYGADVVIAEPFPFYVFDGVSVINVYREQSSTGQGKVDATHQ